MRSRSNSGVRLDYYNRLLYKTVIKDQDPVTGLIPASGERPHAWVRDNVYCALAIWSLSMAYKKSADLDEDRSKFYELDGNIVKIMRSLLVCMMRQKTKVEKFKSSQSTRDSLHAKYNTKSCGLCESDHTWGHLQIDATSLYLLVLAQMTASGLRIIFDLEEVSFVQNLVFYIESAYFTPDYGIWERGDKTNHGLPELNASSIGMAKAAMEAMNNLDLFGAHGGTASVISVLSDEAQKCQAVLQSMLPRESISKEVDCALLSVISFPAFAVDDAKLIDVTRTTILDKLQGRYGCRRFLRDGYRTAREDRNRLYYEPWELQKFENIECEWPLFFCFLAIDYCYQGNKEAMNRYMELLDSVSVKSDSGIRLVPEIYAVPADKVEAEVKKRGSQDREPQGRLPFLWAQSLYIVAKLLQENFIQPSEMDPLNRRLGSEIKPDVVVQVAIVAENSKVKHLIEEDDNGMNVPTVESISPIEIQPARLLGRLYQHLGKSRKLEMSGRHSLDVGILSTSKLYKLHNRLFAFTPQLMDQDRFFIASDIHLLLDMLMNEINFLQSNWYNMMGRPLVTMVIRESILEDDKVPQAVMTMIKKIKSGYVNGTRVSLGNISDFLSTSCMSSLEFLNDHEGGVPYLLCTDIKHYLENRLRRSFGSIRRRPTLQSVASTIQGQMPTYLSQRRKSFKGSVKRTRSSFWEDLSTSVWKMRPVGTDESLLDPNPSIRLLEDKDSKLLYVDDTRIESPTPSITVDDITESPTTSYGQRTESDTMYDNVETDDLLTMLKNSSDLDEQGDILHFLYVKHGLDHIIESDSKKFLVRDLYMELYDRASHRKRWDLVRHSAGILGKRIEDLAKSVSDVLVRQKQLTIGNPTDSERTITAPLPAGELRQMIHHAYGKDETLAMLTQELLLYISMFIRTEPHLFSEMLRLRVGLIIQVMAAELQRALHSCSAEEAADALVNLSPFEMKNLLYHIVSGKEFNLGSRPTGSYAVLPRRSAKISKKSEIQALQMPPVEPTTDTSGDEQDKSGQWLRRRRLDGALNRVPVNFYPRLYAYLEKAPGIHIAQRLLPRNVTQEMTPGEIKFALLVESQLTLIPEPEFRQLVVEAIMVLTLLREHDVSTPNKIIEVESIVHRANDIFLNDQIKKKGDATLCCARKTKKTLPSGHLYCEGASYVCTQFYDSAPSGSYGTMTYMLRAVAEIVGAVPREGEVDCNIQ